ncbi:MAG: hypothetical protein PF693_21175 [Spirochaetia bacterium]|jgi:hypothetical protein|nr:hypothetical protein [Spirochaetia bacterium]
MYYIKKYIEGLAIHNDATGESHLLTEQEKQKALEIYPVLADRKLSTLFIDSPIVFGKEKKAI